MRAPRAGRDYLVFGSILRSSAAERPGRNLPSGISAGVGRNRDMLIEHLGRPPAIDPAARIAPTAVICGDVRVGPDTSIGFGAVLTAESGPIVVGRRCVIMENAVIRGTKRHPVSVGDHVLIGPGAYLSGCAIRDCAFLATGSRVFNGAIVGARAEMRINATVHLLTKLPEDATVPIGWVGVGDPARILPPDAQDEIWAIQETLNFPKEVFGVDRPGPGETRMPEMLARYCRALSRHRDDRIL
jgi:carbonic anhydrase/acetyltransferase-like protein (isoleucine patch superfamily)